MTWIPLNTAEQINTIKNETGLCAIFKHSTRCSISMMVKKRFELDWNKIPADFPLYFLDLIKHRDLSNQVAKEFDVHHESPQLLVIKDGECISDVSHGEVSVDEVLSAVN